ncbi:glycosyltransferase family 2 protein [Aeromicrobium sp.]|uniref:glycosyltransferase family 2 protein n=1 Tax=Aeromicrobium sp. TaxID=1871063 RepID=UPI0019BC097A|nr:glycosyltransferase family 2 protein [Aeromicrobium sp.]MBC7630244.1 glycosyltransferase family 2 protein [Aeromicrobium sp.]
MLSTTAAALPPTLVPLATSGIVSPAAIVKTLLRFEYAGGEDLIAHMASGGTQTFADIQQAARSFAAGDTADVKSLSSPGLYALAFLTAGLDTGDAALARAADLFALARRVARRHGTPTEHADLDLQTNLRAGRLHYVRRHLTTRGLGPWVRWAISADLANPFAPSAQRDHGGKATDDWQMIFDEPFLRHGIAPVRIADPAAPFDSVHAVGAEDRRATVDGPLVSIVMPIYSPSASLVTAVRSLVTQSWKNLQVIMVDDASPEEFAPVFAEACALDDRVEYVRMPTNGGAYRARNHGVSLARGEFVGFQDADDWSHPERVERQMQMFDRDPALVATLSKAIRLYPDLRITKVGSQPFEKNAPSLIFRRQLVVDRLGRYDDMRKAADTEFIERLAAVFGAASVVTLEEPLALYQLTDGSLSRADFRIGWHRDARVSYHAGFRHWHRQIIRRGADPVVESPAGRAFPAPPEFEGVPYPDERPDVVVLADTRAGLVDVSGLPVAIEALANAGLRVGLARGEALRHAAVKRTYPRAAILDVLAAGHASWAPLGASLTPRALLVSDPHLLALTRVEGAVNMRPGRVIVVAGPAVSYDPVAVERVVRELFDRNVEWLPASRDVTEALRSAGITGHLHQPLLAEAVRVSHFTSRLHTDRPVIGTSDSSRFAADRADRRGLLDLLPQGDRHDVRLLESTDRSATYGGRSWLGFPPEMLSTTEFLDQCDFYVGLPPRHAGASLLRPVLEAMSRGCVPIVHEGLRPVLGNAATYYGERSVASIVDEVWGDPAAFTSRQGTALAFCHNEISGEAFASAVAHLLTADRSS